MSTMAPKPKPKTALGKRLLAIRERLDITQEQAAARLGVGRQTWFRWESGKRKPSASQLILIGLLEAGKLDQI